MGGCPFRGIGLSVAFGRQRGPAHGHIRILVLDSTLAGAGYAIAMRSPLPVASGSFGSLPEIEKFHSLKLNTAIRESLTLLIKMNVGHLNPWADRLFAAPGVGKYPAALATGQETSGI